MVTMNMPIEREKAQENQPKGGDSSSIYRPAPDEAGSVFTNELIIGLMYPGEWKMFNPTQSMIDMYGMTGAGISINGEPLVTFYLKLPVHSVSNYKRQDGSVGYTHVICPTAMNDYLVNALGGAPMFHDSVRCGFCEERDRWWEVSNNRWAELGLGVWDLEGKARQEKVKSDPVLSNSSDMARNYRVADRYPLSVFDYSKQLGKRPLDEGQTYVNLQVWFSPKGVSMDLRDHHETGWDFWNLEKPEGVQVVNVKKDTTEVTKQKPWNVEYSVSMAPQRIAVHPDILSYIVNPSNRVDPSSFISISSYEAMVAHIEGQNERPQTSSQNRTYSAPTPQTTPQSPPVAPAPLAASAATPNIPLVPPAAPVPNIPSSPVGAPPVPPSPASVSNPVPTGPAPGVPPIPAGPSVGAPPVLPSPAPSTGAPLVPPSAPVPSPGVPVPPAPTTAPGTPPVPPSAPVPVAPNPIPSISTPDRTPPASSEAAAPPVIPTGPAGLGGKSW